jgi:flagellar motor protein MotB
MMTFILSLVILFKFSPIALTKELVDKTTIFIKSRQNTEYEEDEEYEKYKGINKSNKKVYSVSNDKKESKIDKKKEEIARMLEELKKEKENIKNEKKEAENKKQLQLQDVPKKIQIEKKVPIKIKSFLEKKENSPQK